MPEETNRHILKNSVYLYVRMGIVMIVSLYTVRVVLNTLGVTDYGIYNAIAGVVSTVSIVTGVLISASQRFFSYDLGKNPDKLCRTYSSMLIIYLILAFFIILIIEPVGLWFLKNKMTIPADRLGAAEWVFHFTVFGFIVSLLQTLYNAMIVSHEDMKIYAYLSISDVICKLGLVYILQVIAYDKLKLYAVLVFIVTLVYFILYIVICKRRYKSQVTFSLKIERGLFGSIFKFSAWSMFGSLAGMCNSQGINILLNVFFGPIANAAYAIANQVSAKVTEFSNGFYMAVRPAMIKAYAAGNTERSTSLVIFSSKIIFICVLFLILPIIFECEPILKLWLGNIEPSMIVFTRLLLVYTMILALSNPLTTLAQATGKVKKYHGYVDSFILLSLPTIYILFKLGADPESSFVVVIVIMVIAHWIRLRVLKATIDDFPIGAYVKKFMMPCIATLLISVFLTYTVKTIIPQHDILCVLLRITISILFVLSFSYILLLTKGEKKSLKCMILSKIK